MVAARLFFSNRAEYGDAMLDLGRLKSWGEALERELTDNILHYWLAHTYDREFGGFVGRIAHDNRVDPTAAKGAVLNARILWSFASAYRCFGTAGYLEAARRAYDYICARFLDREHQGVFWTVDHRGCPLDTKKQVYAQAFTIYALAEFHAATGERPPLDLARAIYSVLETRARDRRRGGYLEAYSRDWMLLEDLRLSEKDANEKKSMNTHLHMLEAYTALLRVWPDPGLRKRLGRLIRIFLDHIIDRTSYHLILFFDEAWNGRSRLTSYGHDIECAWLLEEAGRELGDESIRSEVADVSIRMAEAALREGIGGDGGLAYELHEDGRLDGDRHWWPQAEALVGFLNAYGLSGQESFLEASLGSWEFLCEWIVNREHGEWHWSVSPDGRPDLSQDKVGLWKGPYHNSRACLEGMRRIRAILESPG